MDVRESDAGPDPDRGLPAASAVSGFEFGVPRSATSGAASAVSGFECGVLRSATSGAGMNGGAAIGADFISGDLIFAISPAKSPDCLISFTLCRALGNQTRTAAVSAAKATAAQCFINGADGLRVASNGGSGTESAPSES